MVEISILLPTRRRPAELARALDSIAVTADRAESLELVLYVDHDDEMSQQIEHAALKLVRIVGERVRMGEMNRRCYAAAAGRYVMLANDDLLFRTPGWDTAVLAAFARFDDGIALVWGNDLCGGAPAHPFVSRAACEAMGGICPAIYHREFIDTHLYDVFRQLRQLGHDRLVRLPEIIFEHLHFGAGKSALDETYVKQRRFDDERQYLAWHDERTLAAASLARSIERCRRSAPRSQSFCGCQAEV